MKTIALFGGSFDPLHDGHRAIIKALTCFMDIDKIIVIPTYLSPFKSKSHASAESRFEALHVEYQGFKNIEISDYEIKQKTKVASIKSVKHFLKSYKKIYLVIGADILASLHKWQDYEELKTLVTFIVVSRDNIKIPEEYISLHVEVDISSTKLRKNKSKDKLAK